MMTKKHYEELAMILRTARSRMGYFTGRHAVLDYVEAEISLMCAQNNASFNAEKFHAACQVPR